MSSSMPLNSGQSKSERHLTPLQARFLQTGFTGLGAQEIVELLYSIALPRLQSKKRAEKVIERFGTLRAFLTAPSPELRQFGITERGMFFLKLLHELPAEILRQKIVDQPIYQSSKEMFEYLHYSMRDLKKEVFKVIYLNNRNQIIDSVDLFEGTLDGIPIHPPEIVETAIKYNATALIFIHNHPAGNPKPSLSDRRLTRDLVFIGNILQIKVLDHIIIGDNEYFSFADEGLIQKYDDDFLTLRIKGVISPRAEIREVDQPRIARHIT